MLANVAGDAHNFPRWFLKLRAKTPADGDAFTDGIVFRPVFLRHRLIDDDDLRRCENIAVIKRSASPYRYVQGGEVIWADESPFLVAIEAVPGTESAAFNSERQID